MRCWSCRMSRHHSHITSAIKIIETATPGEPLVHHLKKFFAADKKYGSKDRKAISSLCYNYYRMGSSLLEKTTEEKIIGAAFLCNCEESEMLAAIAPEFKEKIHLDVEKKCAFLNAVPADIFPFADELTEEIDSTLFSFSFLLQPSLFIRIRPGKEVKVLEKLTESQIAFEEISASCISLPPATKLDGLINLNKEAVVQDRNSQLVFSYLQQDNVFLINEPSVWDCCAASGGKSILLYDLLQGHAHLTVSDIRENILHNLRNRFKDAGIKNYHSFIADLEAGKHLPEKKYDIIICDTPCTGSGTWARTPEQISFFDVNRINEYAVKQKNIASAAIRHLKNEGYFFYITCSVFKKENEDVVGYLKEKFHLQVLQMEYLKGYERRADTMFVALFTLQ